MVDTDHYTFVQTNTIYTTPIQSTLPRIKHMYNKAGQDGCSLPL